MQLKALVIGMVLAAVVNGRAMAGSNFSFSISFGSGGWRVPVAAPTVVPTCVPVVPTVPVVTQVVAAPAIACGGVAPACGAVAPVAYTPVCAAPVQVVQPVEVRRGCGGWRRNTVVTAPVFMAPVVQPVVPVTPVVPAFTPVTGAAVRVSYGW